MPFKSGCSTMQIDELYYSGHSSQGGTAPFDDCTSRRTEFQRVGLHSSVREEWPMASSKKGSTCPDNPTGAVSFRRFFKHYLSGETFDAWKYGHKAWPIPHRNRKA
jgi:hypothetical protein